MQISICYISLFQSTHPHGVRLSEAFDRVLRGKFQSTHPHGVRLGRSKIIFIGNAVSIHAPTRGATKRRSDLSAPARSFNPRTHTGCDISPTRAFFSSCRFQSTHPHGVRPYLNCPNHRQYQFQSTHPHGVRLFGVLCICTCNRRFNPRTHTGCDVAPRGASDAFVMFQSTHPHGVRRISTSHARLANCFNPRTHTGCD